MEPKWRIYYSDGTTFDDTMGTPADAPAFGVIVIVQRDPTVRRTMTRGFDWYWWNPRDRMWWAGDLTGVLDHMLNRLPIENLCQGRSVSIAEWQRICRVAEEDPDFRAYLKG